MTQCRRLFLSYTTCNEQNVIFKSNWQLCLNQISKGPTGEQIISTELGTS